MTFVSDGKRTYDADREVELTEICGHPGNMWKFGLRGPDFGLEFYASWDAEYVEGADPSLPAPLRTVVTWRPRILGYLPEADVAKMRSLIIEAFTSYKIRHGVPEGQLVDVSF